MAVIRLSDFKGQLPSRNPELLSPQHAMRAFNLRLTHGMLEPSRSPLSIHPLVNAAPETIFRYSENQWLEFAGEVDIVRSVAANDTYRRVYWTDGDYPKVTDSGVVATSAPPYPSQSFRLGVPAPASAPTLAIVGTGDGTTESRFYVVTYVGRYGEEGPPSPVSGEVELQPGQTVMLSALPAPPSAPYSVTKLRIYRTNTVGTDAVFQMVGEVGAGTSVFHDVVLSADLKEAMQSEQWDMLPGDAVGLTALPNGVFCAFRNNELLFSEPGLPHAWPVDYRRSVDFDIVGLGAMGTEVFVGTKGTCYVVSGTDPAGYAVTSIPAPHSCVSKRSIVGIGDIVVYASEEGLVLVSRQGATLLTEQMFSREEWSKYTPAELRAWRWGRFYLAAYRDGTKTSMFAIDPLRPEDGVVFHDGFMITAGYTDVEEEQVYFATAGQLVRWGGGDKTYYDWCSRPFSLASPEPIRVARVLADTYPVQVRIHRDGVEQAFVEVNNARPRRLPGARLGREYVIQVSANTRVKDIVVASSISELTRA
jgi:hypothetical protein